MSQMGDKADRHFDINRRTQLGRLPMQTLELPGSGHRPRETMAPGSPSHRSIFTTEMTKHAKSTRGGLHHRINSDLDSNTSMTDGHSKFGDLEKRDEAGKISVQKP